MWQSKRYVGQEEAHPEASEVFLGRPETNDEIRVRQRFSGWKSLPLDFLTGAGSLEDSAVAFFFAAAETKYIGSLPRNKPVKAYLLCPWRALPAGPPPQVQATPLLAPGLERGSLLSTLALRCHSQLGPGWTQPSLVQFPVKKPKWNVGSRVTLNRGIYLFLGSSRGCFSGSWNPDTIKS